MNITVPLWLAFAVFLGVIAASSAQGWLVGQYELTRRGHRFAVARRWSGTGAHVCLRPEKGADDPHRYLVLAWGDEDREVPWLRVRDIDDEDAEAFWAPVTVFSPYSVRWFRPHILRTEHYRFPQLFDYRPVRNPSGYLEDAHGTVPAEFPGVPGRRLELTCTSTGQWALFLNCKRLDLSPAADMDNSAAREWASSVFGRDVEWHNAVDAPDERCGYWVADPAEVVATDAA